ncbi:arginine--tRNA ligase [Nanoarchaeota archaeon]
MKEVINEIHKITKLNKKEIENLIEIPPLGNLGDYAFPCFVLSKELKQSPQKIAQDLEQKIKSKEFEKVESNGAYLNFFVDKKKLIKKILKEISCEDFGKFNVGKGKTIVIDFSAPNIAKPFGIGHLRSTIIGNSIANICNFMGFKTIKINYLGDWGTQFGKLITGYKKFGKESELKKDPIKYLLEIYVKINKDKKYENESREWFKKLEQGNKEALNLWKKFRELSLRDFKKLYDILGISFDEFSGESEYNQEMKEIIKKLKEKKLLKKSEGALIVDLEKYNLGNVLIQKSNGSTLYITRDLAAAINRYKKYKFEKMIYEVGQEQELHFKQLFKILELMGNKWAKNCIHAQHGLYLDKDGKKFSTRKGKTIFMENIINDTVFLTKKEIEKRWSNIEKKEIERRALKVAIASISYGDLKNNRIKDMVFDLERFTSFEGDTGPYILYSYARANSILKKVKTSSKKIRIEKLELNEVRLAKKIYEFSEVILKSYKNLNPSYLANYSYQLAQTFNEFYHSCLVINSENETLRIELVKNFKKVLKKSLELLGIETIDEM